MDTNCSTMASYSSSEPLKLSISYNLIMACAGLPLFLWASYKLWFGTYTTNFHRNIRMVIQMHLFGFILHSSGRIVLHCLDLFNYLFLDPCQMVPNIYRCFIFRLMYNLGMWITTCTAVPLVIERSIATWLRGRYENKYSWLGYVLAAMQPLLASFPLYLAYSNTKFDGVFMPYCLVYKPGHPDIANMNSLVAILSQFAARILFGILFFVNKKFRVKLQTSSLSTRFQLEQNKNSTQCLKIYANMSTVFLFVQIGSFYWLLKESPFMPREIYLTLMELNCQFPAYGIVSVAFVTMRISSVRNQVSSALNAQLNVKGKDAYFEYFNREIEAKLKTKI